MMPLRHSALKHFAKSAAHYREALTEQGETTSAMDIGSAADLLILSSLTNLPTQRVLSYPGKTRRGKEWEAFQQENADALIVTKTEHTAALGMVAAVRGHPEAMALLTGTVRETLYWTDTGRGCRGTPDVVSANGKILADLKTGETSDPRRFLWKVKQYSYHAQLAWYRHGLTLAGKPRPEQVYIVAVEQKPPHVVTVFRLTEQTLDLGHRLNRTWLGQLLNCEAANEWPGYSQCVVDLTMPDESEGIEFDDIDDEALTIADAGTEGVE